jgi:nitroreductase
MSVWDAVEHKRVIRRFADGPIAPDELVRILNAGRRAASSKNLQRWHFIVCRDREHLAELGGVGPWAGHLAMAAANMMLVAWELGIGSVPATVYEHDLARRLLGYPEDHHCEFLISFGYPADPDDLTRPNKAGGRVALTDIVHDERW